MAEHTGQLTRENRAVAGVAIAGKAVAGVCSLWVKKTDVSTTWTKQTRAKCNG